jgi:hypothetical protein
VFFESGASLLAMIENDMADLDFDAGVYVCEWDGVMCFPGYSVSISQSIDNCVRLIKDEWE